MHDRINTVDLLIKYNKVVLDLGCSSSRPTLHKWYYEFDSRHQVCYKRKDEFSEEEKNMTVYHNLNYI